MATAFIKLLKSAHKDLESIQMELLGYTKVDTPTKQRGRVVGTEKKWEPPENPPKNKKSETLNEIIQSHYPEAEIRRTSAKTLLLIWNKMVSETRGSNLRSFMELFRLLQPILESFYPNESTLSTSTTAWRKPILEKFGNNSEIYKQSTYVLGISRERSLARRKEYTDKVREATRSRGKMVKYTQEQIFEVIDSCDQSSNELDYIIAVLLCTGSRLIEAIKLSAYTEAPGKPGYIKLVGIAKDRATKSAPSVKSIVKPVIRLTPRRIIEMVQTIRSRWNLSFAENSAATALLDGPVNRRLADFFGETDADMPETKKTTAHRLRHIYASLSYQLYGAPEGVAENEWVREVLGHDSNEVSVAYQSVVVELPGKKSIPSDIRYQIGELEHEAKNNKEEHAEIKKDVKEVATELNRQISNASVIDVEFPELANPKRIRLSTEAKLDRLRRLDQALHDAGIRMSQRLAKKYKFGSSTVSSYWKVRPEVFA